MRKKKETPDQPKYSKGTFRNSRYKSKSQHSIIHKHDKRMEEFKNKDLRLTSIDNKIKACKRELDKLTNDKSYKQLNNEQIGPISVKIEKLYNDMETYKKERHMVSSGEDEIKYILEASRLIVNYIDLEEKERKILNKVAQSEDDTIELNNISTSKNDIVELYGNLFDPEYISIRNTYNLNYKICKDCDVHFQIEHGFQVCPSCGICNQTIECSGDFSFKEMQDYDHRPQFTYDKMTHLEDWLRRFQARENRLIPQEVLDKVLMEAKKERIKDLGALTESKVKGYLGNAGLEEYYDNVISIINRINGRPPFRLTQEIEDKIKFMFQQIQEPFERYKPKNRKNFLSYSYTLHKMFQILGLHEFSKYFQLLKSADKLRQQDEIFKKVVAEMSSKDKSVNWVFYPSI